MSRPLRIDLHRHLEGSHSPEALIEVARRFDIRDPLFFDESRNRFREASELVPSLRLSGPSNDARLFYRCIEAARRAYVSEAAIAELVRHAFAEAALETDGFEMRISLFSMTRTLLERELQATGSAAGASTWRDIPPVSFAERARRVLLSVLSGREAAKKTLATSVPMLVRIGLSRTFESEPHYRALAEMLREHRSSVVGLDVLGIVVGPDKEPMPTELRRILDELRGDIPDLTVHAGEFESYESVERTLALSPQAIGHGVRSLENQALLERLAKSEVTLEVCTTSNQLLIPDAIADLVKRHSCTPLVSLQRASVHCVLGSDDPIAMGTSYANEWQQAEALGADMERLHSDIDRRFRQIANAARS